MPTRLPTSSGRVLHLGRAPRHPRPCIRVLACRSTAGPTQDSVAEPLLPHFLQFYEADENLSPPLKLEACARIQVWHRRLRSCRAASGCCQMQQKCSGAQMPSQATAMHQLAAAQSLRGSARAALQGEGVRLVEPLQHLLMAVRRVLCAAGSDAAAADDEGGATAALRLRFAALRRRLAEGCLEDFQMDASVGERHGRRPWVLGRCIAGGRIRCPQLQQTAA